MYYVRVYMYVLVTYDMYSYIEAWQIIDITVLSINDIVMSMTLKNLQPP